MVKKAGKMKEISYHSIFFAFFFLVYQIFITFAAEFKNIGA